MRVKTGLTVGLLAALATGCTTVTAPQTVDCVADYQMM